MPDAFDPPVGSLTLTGATGAAPLSVHANASASTSPESGSRQLDAEEWSN
jgi:hypothetical protein